MFHHSIVFFCQKIYIKFLKIFFHKNTKIKPTSIEIVLESTFLFSMKFHQMLHKKNGKQGFFFKKGGCLLGLFEPLIHNCH